MIARPTNSKTLLNLFCFSQPFTSFRFLQKDCFCAQIFVGQSVTMIRALLLRVLSISMEMQTIESASFLGIRSDQVKLEKKDNQPIH